jgi:dihydrodipicolinate synthase/N-acetylneuraminate lyase
VSRFASADLCLYDNPFVTKTWLTAAQVCELGNAVPALTHVKMTDTAIGKVGEIVSSSDLAVFAGEDSVLWHHLLEGVSGVMSAAPMFYPEACANLWAAFADGRHAEALATYRQIAQFIPSGIHGDDYIPVVKSVLAQRGAIASAEVRVPLLALSERRLGEVLSLLGVGEQTG